MSSLPTLMPTAATDETYGGVTYHIAGELVPALSIDISHQPVYFEHHVLLWKNPSVRITLRPMRGALKRMIAGMQIFVTEAYGKGIISFSRDGPGHIVPLHLARGQEIHVREHQFLAATSNVDYEFERVRGFGNIFFGGNGFFIDKFKSESSEGVLWLHGYGNVFEKELARGESIDVEPHAWLYKDTSVQMETIMDQLTSGWFGGINMLVNRFYGPGRIGIQSMYCGIQPAGR